MTLLDQITQLQFQAGNADAHQRRAAEAAPPHAKPCHTCGRLIWGSVRQGPGEVLDVAGPHTCFPEKLSPPGMASVSPSAGFYRVYDSNQTDAETALYVKVTADGVVWGFSEYEGVPGYRTLGKQWVTFAAEHGNERLRWMPDRDRLAAPPAEEWRRRWLSEAEIAGVRRLLARGGGEA